MGGILLQAGDVRVCGPESYILIHEIAAGTGGKIGEIEDDVKFYRRGHTADVVYVDFEPSWELLRELELTGARLVRP